jgi:hypothetical protein
MASSILIIAESGAGKSTSIANLDPKETFIVNVANKPLPFKGWKSKYKIWTKEDPTGNMYTRPIAKEIEGCLKYVSEKRPEIKNIIIDDFQYIFAFEYFDRAEEKGFDKFTSIAKSMASISKLPIVLREDLHVFFLTHAEESQDLEGRRKFKAKTIGKLVDNSLTLEGLFSIVLFGKVKKDKDGNMKYIFETQNNGENTCKSPAGMFESVEIPNDLEFVKQAIINYEN